MTRTSICTEPPLTTRIVTLSDAMPSVLAMAATMLLITVVEE